MKKTVLVTSLFLAVAVIILIRPESVKSATIGKTLTNQSTLNRGLVGWWTYDGPDVNATKVLDKSGQGNHGTKNGSMAVASGKTGQAGSFDGATSYVNAGTSAILQPASAITISFWFKANLTNVSYDMILGDTNSDTLSKGYSIYLNSNVIAFHVDNYNINRASKTFTDTKSWHHVIGKWVAGEAPRIWVDLVKGTDGTATSSIDYTGAVGFVMGSTDLTASGFKLNGKLDDVRVYNRALSWAEIQQLYKQGGGKIAQTPANTTNLKTGLVGWWTFDADNTKGLSYAASSFADGDMETAGTASWSKGGTVTLSKEITSPHGGTQVLRVTKALAGSGDDYAYQAALTVGKTYRVRGWARGDGTAHPVIGDSLSWTGTTSASWQYFDITKTTASTVTYFYTIGASIGNYTEWDDISVMEVKPAYSLDKSGNGNMATSSATSLQDIIKGKIGQAMNFDGVDDYLSINDSSGLDGSSAMSWGGWFYLTSSGDRGLIGKVITGGGFYQYDLSNYSGLLYCLQSTGGSGWETLITAAIPSLNKWHHIICTNDNTVATLYIDNVAVGTDTEPATSLCPSGESLKIGSTIIAGSVTYLKGMADDIRVYNRALSAKEITQLYQQGLGDKQSVSSASRFNNGLVGYWTFDGADCGAAYCKDKSGNGNTGTITGATKTVGRIGQALNFDIANVSVAENTSLKPTQITASAWVYPTSFATNWSAILMKSSSGSWNDGYGLARYTGANDINFFVNAYNGVSSTVASTLSLNKWSFVVGTYDLVNIKIYVNGDLKASKAFWTAINHSTSALLIGQGAGSTAYAWKGKIDEARVYNRALSAQEVKQLYQMGK